ncbi:MAG: TM2 domain-containing protein [Acidimicrobiia bacterium]
MTLPPDDLPPVAAAGFQAMSEEERQAFITSYSGRRRSMPLMIALAILFPIQLFFLGRIGLGILFLLTGGGFGVWYVIEWFVTPSRVRDYNTRVATETLAMVGSPAAVAAAAEEEE